MWAFVKRTGLWSCPVTVSDDPGCPGSLPRAKRREVHASALVYQVERLIREIGSRGRLGSKKTSGVTGGESERSHGRGDSLCSDLSLSSTSSFHSYKRQPSALSWSPSEVQQWLSSQQLDHVADR